MKISPVNMTHIVMLSADRNGERNSKAIGKCMGKDSAEKSEGAVFQILAVCKYDNLLVNKMQPFLFGFIFSIRHQIIR